MTRVVPKKTRKIEPLPPQEQAEVASMVEEIRRKGQKVSKEERIKMREDAQRRGVGNTTADDATGGRPNARANKAAHEFTMKLEGLFETTFPSPYQEFLAELRPELRAKIAPRVEKLRALGYRGIAKISKTLFQFHTFLDTLEP
jgi:hypothetical protein